MIRVGLIGAGSNTRARHVPGLRAVADVEIVAVCNRRPGSTAAVARELGIPRTFETWQDLVADGDIDAVVIGTWPYLHAPITLAALAAGKHVLTEARLAMNAAEAHQMLAASKRHPHLVCQVVPSPFGLTADAHVRELLAGGYLGQLREVQVTHRTAALADATAAMPWRQDAALSGVNTLTLGIIHETLLRWLPQPVRVFAQATAFIPERVDPASGARRPVGTPDSVQVLCQWPGGACGAYQFSGVTPVGQQGHIALFGSAGALCCDFVGDRLLGAQGAATMAELKEIEVPAAKRGGWRVEADFIDSIRSGAPVRYTDFATGVAYMEFTEAVARSAQLGVPVRLPLAP